MSSCAFTKKMRISEALGLKTDIPDARVREKLDSHIVTPDIPAHTYQATFEPNKEWSSFYAPAPEIHHYWKRVAGKYGCWKYIKLKHRVLDASWDEGKSKWKLQVQDDAGTSHQDECNVLIQATGSLNNWRWPSIPGLHDFKGKLMHSAAWETDYDYTNQNVAIVGNGSSGIQILPAMLPKVNHIDHYVRSRTWISPTFAREYIDKRSGDTQNSVSFSQEEIDTFKKDHAAYQQFRKEVELQLQSIHGTTLLGNPTQLAERDIIIDNMKKRLAKKPELLDELIPSFPVACRRLTPGPGYLEALADEKVALIKSNIIRVDETGIVTEDGNHRPISCERAWGVSLADRWKESTETYLSIATDGFPNYFICFGPNSAVGEGNLLLLFEKEIDYFTECVRKMQRDHIASMSVRPAAVQQFAQYCDEYFKRTVFSARCRSWYKGGAENGRVTALWPGSSLHALEAFAHPRWEDYEYEYVTGNAFGWIGDGWTENEKYNRINVNYLDDDQVDFPQPVDCGRSSRRIAFGPTADDLICDDPIFSPHYPGSPPRWTTMAPADKHFRCTVCQRGFTRVDHLKRHHLRHSGQKPYSCVFCNEAFARCDNLRDHYTDCAKRGDRKIPETGQRGRRRHACQSCTLMKLRCDGQSPCGSCVKRNLDCNNERNTRSHNVFDEEEKPDMYAPSSDRGSIKFLLNGGTDSFIEQFRLPPRTDRGRSLIFDNQTDMEEGAEATLSYNVQTNRPDLMTGSVDPFELSSLQFFQDTFLDFFTGPFSGLSTESHKPTDDHPFNEQLAYPPSLIGQRPQLALSAEQAVFEPERPFAMALVQSILARAWTVPLDAKAQEEISANLNQLLTTARIRKFISFYFKYWQKNCAMIHAPTFNPETVGLPLLAAVVFMGAIYSTDQREVYMAKRVLDFAELFIFSSNIYASDFEAASIFTGSSSIDDGSDWNQFQTFLAGFIIMVVQYWAGCPTSRNRAMEIARRLKLTKSRHLPHEGASEQMWIQTECRIRTMSFISLLDCAFLFFQNYPCRLTMSDTECEFPCSDALFKSEHPFADPTFRLSRNLTIREAFQNLFVATPFASPQPTPETNRMDLIVLDMFILIHILFAFINQHMTFVGLIRRHPLAIQSVQSPGGSTDSKSMIPEDTVLSSIMIALGRWREYWAALRTQVTHDEWASMGFYKNGYNFWLVSQLLITKKDAVEIIMKMEVNCEDKLQRLAVLLQNEKD
ncbi:hypothetical protein N7470_007802 [Penicillium chermesinum]|nr:hypothetical protein N7470_007802 [Penicillium chermesinum]